MLTWMGPRNHVLDGGSEPLTSGQFRGQKGRLIINYRDTLPVSCAKTAERSNAVMDMDSSGHKEAHWCLLVNMSEPSMGSGDAALCKLTLTFFL